MFFKLKALIFTGPHPNQHTRDMTGHRSSSNHGTIQAGYMSFLQRFPSRLGQFPHPAEIKSTKYHNNYSIYNIIHSVAKSN